MFRKSEVEGIRSRGTYSTKSKSKLVKANPFGLCEEMYLHILPGAVPVSLENSTATISLYVCIHAS